MPPPARDRFLALLRAAVRDSSLVRLTLAKPRRADLTLRQLIVRPVTLQAGPRLSLVWRHATRDITKNLPPAGALALLEPLIGDDFLDAHLHTATQTAQLETRDDGTASLHVKTSAAPAAVVSGALAAPHGETGSQPSAHDRPKAHLIPADAPWLRALGVTNDHGQPRAGMADKFRQIQKFTELLAHLLDEAAFAPAQTLRIADMGSGKGYLTFALAALLGDRAHIHGIEARPELVTLCNQVAHDCQFSNLAFTAGQIADSEIQNPPQRTGVQSDKSEIQHRESKIENPLDVLLALHACDTATDDALARGVAAGARLLVVAPCCQRELRSQLTAPPVLAAALAHGIFQERQAEFVTDALRAQLLEWAGYRVKVFEFISTEHTAKNLMIAAIKSHAPRDLAVAEQVRVLARFYGIRSQHLAHALNFSLSEASSQSNP